MLLRGGQFICCTGFGSDIELNIKTTENALFANGEPPLEIERNLDGQAVYQI